MPGLRSSLCTVRAASVAALREVYRLLLSGFDQ